MLFHALHDARKSLYFEQVHLRITGDLEPQTFAACWQSLVQRHSIFRTAFVGGDGEDPVALIFEKAILPVKHLDWREKSEAHRDTAMETYLRQDRDRGFTMSEAPLARLALIRWQDQVTELVWSAHHILLDGWCTPLILKQVFTDYAAARGIGPGVVENARPFRNYIAWLNGRDRQKEAAFWRSQLSGFSQPTPPLAERRDGRGRGHDRTDLFLGLKETAGLKSYARRRRMTLNTVCQGVWAALLGLYSGSEDVVFGCVVSGRPASLDGVETIIGPFINTLPLRVFLDPAMSPGQLFEQIQDRFSEIREFETTGLADVRAWSEVAPDKPLFETVLVFENYPVEEGVGGNENLGLNASLRSSFGYNSFPVTLMVHEMDGNLGLRLSFDCSRFAKGTMERVLHQVRRALAGLDRGNTKTLQELSFTTEGDLRASTKWNETDAPIQIPKTLHKAFEARAAVNPHAQALLFQGADGKPQQMSYGHLNRLANRLAHFLGSRGIGPGSTVALLVGRTPWMVVTRLAVWKSGAAFVPLDPSHPRERLNSVMQESEPDLLMVESASLGRDFHSDVVTFQLDELAPELENRLHTNPDVVVDASFPAYVVHTSGSTGKPKGVVCHHGGAANYLDYVVSNVGLNHSDTVLQLAAPAFDASVRDTMAPLLVGALVVLVGEGDAREPRALAETMLRHRVTCLASVVPSLLGLLLESLGQESKPPLRLILSSGEPLHEGLVTVVKKILGPRSGIGQPIRAYRNHHDQYLFSRRRQAKRCGPSGSAHSQQQGLGVAGWPSPFRLAPWAKCSFRVPGCHPDTRANPP